MQTQNNAMPATVNLEVDMVAQRIGGATSTALTVPGDVRINTSGSSDGKEKKVEPENKRVRGTAPRAHKRTASEDSKASTSSRRSVWSGLGAQLDSNDTSGSFFDLSPSPPKAPIDDSGWTIISIVDQMNADRDDFRRRTQKLQDTIADMYASQRQQMADHLAMDKSTKMQQAAFIECSKDLKSLKDKFDTTRAAEVHNNNLRQET